ncbi:hypothetical protein [Paenibacillus sp. 1011MAR3C5]|uniref:hypothetical protein n=1 Tax=Paenibacillus sp. 1011MAR3C5 TaxID=1675787 RepID=UPI002175E458|nr:hypothetical protein [Paenibacillus sp. 1011MAR3C5]
MIDNGKPLTQSGVSERIWELAVEDLDAFEREVERYYRLAYPGFTPVKYDFERRIIWLRDDR